MGGCRGNSTMGGLWQGDLNGMHCEWVGTIHRGILLGVISLGIRRLYWSYVLTIRTCKCRGGNIDESEGDLNVPYGGAWLYSISSGHQGDGEVHLSLLINGK